MEPRHWARVKAPPPMIPLCHQGETQGQHRGRGIPEEQHCRRKEPVKPQHEDVEATCCTAYLRTYSGSLTEKPGQTY